MNLNYKLLIPAALIVLAVTGAISYYVYSQSQKTSTAQNPQVSTQEEVKKLVAEVGKLIALPEGEDPTVATVTDIEKLREQPFFQKAKKGDKVLIYTQAKKAILYDPQAKKIIDVAPINIGTSSATPAGFRVGLRNGTTTVGLTTRVETELKKTIPDLNVTSKENAEEQNYDISMVVILNDSARDLAESIAKALNIKVADLPAGELNPKDTDILVIL